MSLFIRLYGPPSAGGLPPANQPGLGVQATNPAPLPVTQLLTGTAETLIGTALNAAIALAVQMAANTNQGEMIPFDVNIAGLLKTTNTTNLTLTLYAGTAIVSGNLLKASGAIAQNTLTRKFWIRAKLFIDSTTGELDGTVGFYVNRTLVAEATLANFPTGFINSDNPSANPPVVSNMPSFCFSLTSSAASGSNPTTITTQTMSCG